MDAVYNEVLRITSASSSVRTVISPTQLHGKILSPGKTVLIPYRQLHLDEEVFGEDALHFRPERYLRDKDLAKNPSFKPFGGGATYCPGRFFAQREIYTFTAMLLNRFEVSLRPFGGESDDTLIYASPFPKLEDTKPCLGIMGPMKGEDVVIFVRPLDSK